MPLQSVAVGQKYPGKYPPGHQGGWLRLAKPLQLLGIMDYRSGDRKAWERGPIRVSVHSEEAVPFFALKTDTMELDAYFNAFQWLGRKEDYLDPFIEEESNLLMLCLINRPDGTVKAMRQLGLRPEMMRIVREAAAEQLRTCEDGAEVNRAYRRVSAKRSVKYLLENGSSMDFGKTGPFS